MKTIKQVLIPLILAVLFANTAIAQLGELPPDPDITWKIQDVDVELALRFWVDPALVEDHLPPGVRFRTVQSYGIPDSVIATAYHHWIDASLVAVTADVIEIGGVPVETGPRGANFGFWWLQIEEGNPAEDPRTRARHETIEMGVWLEDLSAVDRLTQSGSRAFRGAVSTEPWEDGWKITFSLGDSEITGRCRLKGDVVVEEYALPAYSTVWQAGLGAFYVFTFQGHQWKRCPVEDLDVRGEGVLAQALRASAELQDPFGVAMFGWEAQAGVYVRR